MRGTLKFLLALAVAFIAMLAFRALAFTIYNVGTADLEPLFLSGDRVVVNRWSYGLRTGGEGLFAYGRIAKRRVGLGDIVAVDDSVGQVLLCQCLGGPGDTVRDSGRTLIVPGIQACARQDYYYVKPLGHATVPAFVPERSIIGRACLVVYSHDPAQPFWRGFRKPRFLLPR